MRKIYLFHLCICALFAAAQTPDFAWARGAGSSSSDEVTSIAADAAGNVYATGYFSGNSIAFGSTTLTNSNPGGKDVFLVRYDRTGSVVWAKRAGGSDDDEGTAVAVDGAGNVYLCGTYESTSINLGSAALTNSSNPGLSDVFLAKYNAAGAHQWSHSFGGSLQEEATGIAVDAAGNAAMTGNFHSLSVLFGGFGVVNSGVSDAFAVKFNAAGTTQWAKQIGGGQTDTGTDVGIDGSGNVYVTGEFNSTTISSFSPALTNAGGVDVFVAKMGPTGSVLFSLRFGGSGDEGSAAIHAQTGGDFYVAGFFESGTLNFGAVSLSNTTTRSMYLTKYNTTGTAQWAQKVAGSQNSVPTQLAEGTGAIYMTGSFDLSSLTLGSVNLSNGGSLDAFVAAYNPSTGSVIWGRSSASSSLEQSQAVAYGNGMVHIGGLFTNTLTLRDTELNAVSSTDGFVTKLCPPPAAPISATGATACAGSPVNLTASTPAGTRPAWFTSASGGTALQFGASFMAAAGATYYVAAQDTNAGCAMYSSNRIAVSGSSYPPVNPSITVSGHTLHAVGNGSVTAWYDCDDYVLVPGATGSSYVLNSSGHFAVIMTSPQGCKDTSSCNHYSYTPGTSTVVVTVGLPESVSETLSLGAYPNPSQGRFVLTSNKPVWCDLYNSAGQIVEAVWLQGNPAGAVTTRALSAGVYFLVPRSGEARPVRLVALE